VDNIQWSCKQNKVQSSLDSQSSFNCEKFNMYEKCFGFIYKLELYCKLALV
jgi:hypothetical protein